MSLNAESKTIECILQLKVHQYQFELAWSTMTHWPPMDSLSQWAGRLGWPASSLSPPPLPLLVASPLLDLLWHCPLPLHGGRQQPCFTGGTGTAEGCCTTHHLSAQLCTSAVSCTSLHAPLHWLCRWTVTASTQVTEKLTALSLSLWLVGMCRWLCEEVKMYTELAEDWCKLTWTAFYISAIGIAFSLTRFNHTFNMTFI